MKNKVKKVWSKAMEEKAEESLSELRNTPNGMFNLMEALDWIVKKVKEVDV